MLIVVINNENEEVNKAQLTGKEYDKKSLKFANTKRHIMDTQTTFCQSCGMPLDSENVTGTNHDGSKNPNYCIYCYNDGAFTVDCTMQEMIAISLHHMKEMFEGNPEFNEQEALEKMNSFFPELKRWKTDNHE